MHDIVNKHTVERVVLALIDMMVFYYEIQSSPPLTRPPLLQIINTNFNLCQKYFDILARTAF